MQMHSSYTLQTAWLFLFLTLHACTSEKGKTTNAEALPATNTMKFVLMDQIATGVRFINQVKADYNYNHFSFEYIYNGGGVAAGDVNGDGLPDLYFSASLGNNRLYLNTNDMKFRDITNTSKVQAASGFKTGVTMADVNGDGRLDIYVCRTSKSDDGLKSDLLFINMGNKDENGVQVPTFEEQSKKMGLDDNSNTNHASFFDFDRDGDLDLFLVNHKLNFQNANKMRVQQNADGSFERVMVADTPFESNRLFRNDNGTFRDITKQAGLVSSAYGLSATVADINQDGWMDVYVANDYVEPDFVYINNHNGTFTDRYKEYLRHSSLTSMGSDIADINNDGLVDIMVLDMKPEDHVRYKMLAQNDFERHNLMVQNKYGRQSGRNVLQLNNGNLTFSDIGQFAGVAATDWSWGVLMVDFDNDGWKDIYISNGYRKDVTELDYLNYTLDSLSRAVDLTPGNYPDINAFVKNLPETKIPGYLFSNRKNLQFQNVTTAAGMDQNSFSNGCAYADLDLDGDLDIIVNNIDEPAFLYRNESQKQNWLQIELIGSGGNTKGIGATADVYTGGIHQYVMMITSRGFFSSSEPILHIGMGAAATVDSIVLHWPDGSSERMENVASNRRITWKQGQEKRHQRVPAALPRSLFERNNDLLKWSHTENPFIDFKSERLIPYYLSAEGPCMAIGDINGDKYQDVFLGNGRGFPAALFAQAKDGSFTASDQPAFLSDRIYEDCGAVIEDFDGDGDQDLMVISGGHDLAVDDPAYMTRYYINDGSGKFTREINFPQLQLNAGTILAFDYDQDQDMDVIIGGRSTPGRFPAPPPGYVLRNDNGKFVDVTSAVFAELKDMGMLTDMKSGDLNGDGKDELVIAGDWMPLRIYAFDGKKFTEKSESFGLGKSNGWWKSLEIADIDLDGDMDLLAGNMGLNHRLNATMTHPITLVAKDFDGNGSIDPIMCYYHDEKLFPFAQRDAIIGQIPILKKKFSRYNQYAKASLEDIFSQSELNGSTYHYTHTFRTTLYRNDNKKLVPVVLPNEAQLHPVYDMVIEDFNGDKKPDILLAGNFLYSETETGEMDAGNGTVLFQKEDGTFEFLPNRHHGFWAQAEVRELKRISLADGRQAILTGNNKGPVEVSILLAR